MECKECSFFILDHYSFLLIQPKKEKNNEVADKKITSNEPEKIITAWGCILTEKGKEQVPY